jgi:hypothetical protein
MNWLYVFAYEQTFVMLGPGGIGPACFVAPIQMPVAATLLA